MREEEAEADRSSVLMNLDYARLYARRQRGAQDGEKRVNVGELNRRHGNDPEHRSDGLP